MKTIDKFLNASALVHFLVYFVITFIIFCTCFYLMSDKSKLNTESLFLFSAITAAMLSLMGAWSQRMAINSKKYFDTMRAYRKQACNAKTSSELEQIRKEAVNYYHKKGFGEHQTSVAKDLITLIDTRLMYEFKTQFLSTSL